MTTPTHCSTGAGPALAPFIERRRQTIAAEIYAARQLAEAARIEAAAIKAVYGELFGSPA